MQQTESNPYRETTKFRWSPLRGALLLCVIFALAVLSAGCGRTARPNTSSPAVREASMREIAAEFARSGDLAQAQARLDELNFANPGQLLITLAETDLGAGRPVDEVKPMADLAQAMGVSSPKLVAYFAPTAAPTATPSPVPPTDTPAPATATPEPPTAEPPTETATAPAATAEPPTAAPTEAPANPRVVANTNANVRSGPGRGYPVIGSLRTGQEVEVSARNANGDWWRITWNGQAQAWVSGTTVRLQGQIDTVKVANNIPALPPTNTPRPTTPPAEQPPANPPPAPAPSGGDYRIIEQRMLTIQENGGCNGMHNIFVQVLDANGAPVNGAVVQGVYPLDNPWVGISGQKDCYWNIGVTGQGCISFDLYQNANNMKVVSDPVLGPVTSEVSRQLSSKDTDITVDEFMATGYCTEGRENCEWRKNPGDRPPQLCNGHYSWVVKFQRTR